jgi:lipoprotein NlpI
MFSWFNANDAQQFGTTLADFFIERVSLDDLAKKEKASQKKQEVVQKMIQQIGIYKTNNKINLFKKAKLANSFKWKLLDANYPSELVDELTKIIVVNF